MITAVKRIESDYERMPLCYVSWTCPKYKNKGGCELWTNFFYPNFMIYGLCSLLRCYQLTVAHIQGSSLYYAVVSETIHSCIFLVYQVQIRTNGSTI